MLSSLESDVAVVIFSPWLCGWQGEGSGDSGVGGASAKVTP
jgi:hypothetical protein